MGELRSDGHGGAAAKWMVTKSETGKKSYSKMSSETHDAEASLSTGPELTTAQIVTANETMDLKFSTAVGHYVSVERWSELNAIPVPVNVETDQYVDDVEADRAEDLIVSRSAPEFTIDLDDMDDIRWDDPQYVLAGVRLNPADQLRFASSGHAEWICDKEGLEQGTQDLLANDDNPKVRARMLASVFVTRETLFNAHEKIRAADSDGAGDAYAQDRLELASNFMTPAVILAELASYPEDGSDVNRVWAAGAAEGALNAQAKDDRDGRSFPRDIAASKRGRGAYAYNSVPGPGKDMIRRYEKIAASKADDDFDGGGGISQSKPKHGPIVEIDDPDMEW